MHRFLWSFLLAGLGGCTGPTFACVEFEPVSLNELEGLGVLPHWPEVRINGNLVQGGAELEWAWCTGRGQPATASVSSLHSDPEGSSNATFAGPWTGPTYLTAHLLKCLTDRSQGHR